MKKILLILCFFCIGQVHGQNVDIRLLRTINLERDHHLDRTFQVITNSAFYVSLAPPLAMYAAGVTQKDSSLKYKAIYIGEALAVAGVISTVLKTAVNRPRPFVTYPDIDKETSGGSPSFPSGHTSDAFAAATSVSIVFPKWYVIAPSFIWAAAVGYSRMDLGVHYPSDVLAGAIVGSGSAYLSYKLNNWVLHHVRKRK